MSYKEDDADYVIANLNRANEILRARVAERDAEMQMLATALAETEALEMAHGERIEKLTKLLLLAKDVIEKAAAMTGHPDVFNYLQEALAAINDSKLVEGLILCDAEPIGEIEAIDVDEDAQPSAWIRINTDVELGDQLYAPRRTE